MRSQKGIVDAYTLAFIGILVIVTFVGAYYWGKNSNNQILSSPSPATQSDVSDWKTYTHKSYKFEFKYPPNWQVAELKEDGSITIKNPESKEEDISCWGSELRIFRPETYTGTIKMLEPNVGVVPNSGTEITSFEKINIDKNEAIKTYNEAECGKAASVKILRNQMLYPIAMDYKTPKSNMLKDKILSTFRFN